MSLRSQKLARIVLAIIGVALCPRLSAAQDSGWFAPGTQAPTGPIYTQDVRSTAPSGSTAPGGPGGPGGGMEPLAPSPLLTEQGGVSDQDRDPRALTAWNNDLAPYGAWVDDASYGRVWIPSAKVVGTNFSPYVSGGHWALDEDNEWIWVSEYPFGRIVFHYGRWVWIAGSGWAWVPGLQYAPAWVTWRVPTDVSYSYVGWAPLPPSYVWFGGVAVWWGYPLYYPWVFCSSAYVFDPYVHHHVIYDYDGMAHAAHYTRPYYPPRGYVRQPPRGPEPSAAQIPPDSVPRQRVSARQVAATPDPALGVAGPGARRTSPGPRPTYSAREIASASAPTGAARTRTTPSLTPTPSVTRTQQQRSSVPSLDRQDFRTPSFDRPSFTRPAPRVEPMRMPLRTAPIRMSPGAMRRR